MSTLAQIALLAKCKAAAAAAGHPFPGAAAAEAALETATAKGGWFSSAGFAHNNLLGIKATHLWAGATVWIPGWEVVRRGAPLAGSMRNALRSVYDAAHDKLTGEMEWCAFPDFAACYETQMKILHNGLYAAALAARTAEEYIVAESGVWATGPARGTTVLQIFHAHRDILSN